MFLFQYPIIRAKLLGLFLLVCWSARAGLPVDIVLTQATWVTPNIIRVPFNLTGTLITVRARVDTLEGNFFFDTGASGLVLNDRYFGPSVRIATPGAGSVTGAVQVKGQKTIDTLRLDNLMVKKIKGDLVDLGHIEIAKKIDLVGLLGASVFKDFEILVDYSASFIMLIRIDNNGTPIEPIPTWEYMPAGVFPLEIAGHIGIIKLEFGKKKKWSGLDSGAEQNMLHHFAGKRFLKDNFDIRKRVKLRGASKESIEVLTGVLKNAQLDTFTIQPMFTIITNLDEINAAYRTNLDGILGYEFLSQRIMGINLKRKRLTFYVKGPQP